MGMRENLQNGKTSGGPPSHPSNKWLKVRIFMDSWAVGNGLAGGMGKRHEDGHMEMGQKCKDLHTIYLCLTECTLPWYRYYRTMYTESLARICHWPPLCWHHGQMTVRAMLAGMQDIRGHSSMNFPG